MSLLELELELIGPAHGWNWEIKCISLTGHMVEGLCRLLELGELEAGREGNRRARKGRGEEERARRHLAGRHTQAESRQNTSYASYQPLTE